MSEITDLRAAKALDYRRGTVAAAVVDHEDLQIFETLGQNTLQRSAEKPGAIISGNNDAHLCHGLRNSRRYAASRS